MDLGNSADNFQPYPKAVGLCFPDSLVDSCHPPIFNLYMMGPDADDDMGSLRRMTNGVFNQITDRIAQERRNSPDQRAVDVFYKLYGVQVLVYPGCYLLDGRC